MKIVFKRDTIEQTSERLVVHLVKPRRVLSSAPFNGGVTHADRLLILKVMDNFDGVKGPFEPLEKTFQNNCRQNRWTGVTVGMMTSATMSSFRYITRKEGAVEIAVLVTAGVSNARRAGDPAEYRLFDTAEIIGGTINIIVLTNATLTPAAQVEAVMVVTEAKAAVLQDLDVTSPVTGSTATGTGTDATAVINGFGSTDIAFCGKHTLFGEMLASATMAAISSSLKNLTF